MGRVRGIGGDGCHGVLPVTTALVCLDSAIALRDAEKVHTFRKM